MVYHSYFNWYLQTRCCGSISCCVGMCCGAVGWLINWSNSTKMHGTTIRFIMEILFVVWRSGYCSYLFLWTPLSADSGGRAAWREDLKPFDCRDPNCITSWRYGYSSLVFVFVLCCVGSGPWDRVITRSEQFYCVCVCVCVCVCGVCVCGVCVCVWCVCVCGLETSRMRRTRPEWGLLCHKKRLPSLTNASRQQKISFHNKTSRSIHNIIEKGKVYGISNHIFLTGNEPIFLNDKRRSIVVVLSEIVL